MAGKTGFQQFRRGRLHRLSRAGLPGDNRVKDNAMRIQQIRNATMKIKYGDRTILLDPWLQDKGTGFSANAVRPEMNAVHSPMNDLPMTPEKVLADVDICLVTHIHPDHFTPDYLPRAMKIVVQNEEDMREAEAMGFENVTCFEGDTLRLGSVTVTKVPAVHGDNEKVVEMMGPGSGYVLRGGDRKLYLAGDTVYCSAVEQTLEKYRPDVVALNCCEATMPVGRLIMDLADVEAVCRKAPEALVLATHLDSVNHALLTSDDVRNYARARGLTQVCVPKNGEIIEI